ncbi:sensor histidine kinase [Streptomyces violaceusniger]|uniref:sensor histidine kinase n=1 Tax=Streptomyces violaceusniger TaxID=68280 RepID=UPI003F57A691
MMRRLRPTTERARITALYGGLLLLAGGVLVSVIYALVQDDLDVRLGREVTSVPLGPRMNPDGDVPPGSVRGDEYTVVPANKAGEAAKTQTVAALTATTLSRLLTVSGIALGVFAAFRRLNERAHTAGEGAGLGLSIVASIARAHGAEATADANPGGGLSVRIRFP